MHYLFKYWEDLVLVVVLVLNSKALYSVIVSSRHGRVQSPNDVVIQKIEKTLNNTHTIKQKRTNNGFRNTKRQLFSLSV